VEVKAMIKQANKKYDLKITTIKQSNLVSQDYVDFDENMQAEGYELISMVYNFDGDYVMAYKKYL
jgi:hypothetical protein